VEDGEYLWQCLCYIELNMVRCGVVEHPRDWAWVGYHDAGVVSHYKNLLEVEDAFCHLKSYLRVRPVFHWRPDRVRSHVRICFLAYWLSAKLEVQWRQKDQTIEVHNLLRQLQSIRLGRLEVGGKIFKTMVTQVPKDLNGTLDKLGLLPLFAHPPAWAPACCSK